MYKKKEPCRNFQRGSCQYGERCKFLHVNQHPKPNHSFGNGQTNQQQPTFGSPNSSQPQGPSTVDPKHRNQLKPFENKWTRFTPLAVSNSSQTRHSHSDNQVQVSNHKCTDPESCKRLIVEDFEHERPFWKLTCYAHWRHLPCDVVGDISHEELRAAAYIDAKQGLNFQSIIAKERSLLNSKLIEFDNLLHNPYVISSNSISTGASPFSGSNINASVMPVQNKVPPSVSSFSQLGFSINQGSSGRMLSESSGNLGPPRLFQISSQTSVGFGVNNLKIASQGLFGQEQLPPSNFTKFDNSARGSGSPISVSLAAPLQLPSSASDLTTVLPDGLNATVSLVGEASLSNQRTESHPVERSIWLQEKWNPGEIPEEAPPDNLI